MFRMNGFTVFFIASILLAACTPQTAQEPVPLETQQVETVIPENLPPTETVLPTEVPAANGAWVSYRDPRYGIGLAYPCWWTFTPMPTEGIGGAITLRSFDEDYFRAHSTKGNWNGNVPPEGVFAIDIGVSERVNPTLSTVDAWASMMDPSMSVIVSSEEQTIGQNQATVIWIKNVVNQSDPLFTMYLYRLAPDKVLFVSPLFQDRIDSNDVQGVLTSLSLSPDQPIQVPTSAPHAPLIAAACVGK